MLFINEGRLVFDGIASDLTHDGRTLDEQFPTTVGRRVGVNHQFEFYRVQDSLPPKQPDP